MHEPIRFSAISDPDEALSIIQTDIGRVRHLMDSAKREDVGIAAVNIESMALQYFRGKYQTEYMAFSACSKHGICYPYVDKINRTHRVRLAAAQTCGDMLSEMNEKEQEEDIILAGIMQHLEKGGCVNAIQYIFDSKQTEIVLIAYAQKDYKHISKIHRDNLTEKVIWSYLKSNVKAFGLLKHKELLTFDMCLYVMKVDGIQLKNVPLDNFSEDQQDILIDEALSNCAYAVQHLLPEKITRNRAWKCIKKPGQEDSIRYIPTDIRDYAMYAHCASEMPQTLQYVHKYDWFKQLAFHLKIEVII